jgi:hypothetical protein
MADNLIDALVEEREGFLRSGRSSGVIAVDEQLALRGLCVSASGKLVRLDEKPVAKPSRPRKETASAQKAPERTTEKGA